MNPMHKCRGLQLGASCNNRHHDRCPRDIDRGIPISVIGLPALHTTENGLTLAVLFCTVAAGATRTGRIAGVYHAQWHTCKSSLIGEKETELPECPGGMARPLRVS
jgi:hypothetical protein